MGYGLLEGGRNGYCDRIDPTALSPSGDLDSNGEGMNGYHHDERHSDGPEEPLTRTRSWPQLCLAQQQVSMLPHLMLRPAYCGVCQWLMWGLPIALALKGLSGMQVGGKQEDPEEAESTGLVLREHSDSALTVSPAMLQRLSSSTSQVLHDSLWTIPRARALAQSPMCWSGAVVSYAHYESLGVRRVLHMVERRPRPGRRCTTSGRCLASARPKTTRRRTARRRLLPGATRAWGSLLQAARRPLTGELPPFTAPTSCCRHADRIAGATFMLTITHTNSCA